MEGGQGARKEGAAEKGGREGVGSRREGRVGQRGQKEILIIITGLNKLQLYVLALKMALDADRA